MATEEKSGPLDLIGHLGWYEAYRKFWARIKKEAKLARKS